MEFLARLNRRHKAALFLTLLAVGVSLVLGAGAKQTAGIALLGLAFAWAFGSDSRAVHWLFVIAGTALAFAPLCFKWYEHHEEVLKHEGRVAEFERRIPELAKRYPSPEYQYIRLPNGSYGKFLSSASDTDIRKAIERDFPDAYKKRSTPPAQIPERKEPEPFQETQKQSPNAAPPNEERINVYNPSGVLRSIPKREREDALAAGYKLASAYGVRIETPQWQRHAEKAGVNLPAVPSGEMPGVPPDPFHLSRPLTDGWPLEVPGLVLTGIGLGLIFGVRRQPRRTQS